MNVQVAHVTISVRSRQLGNYRSTAKVVARCDTEERLKIGQAAECLLQSLSRWKKLGQGELFGKEGEAK